MNLIERLLSKAGYINAAKSGNPGTLSSNTSNPFTIWAQNKKISPAKALEVYTGWVYAAIRTIAMEISGIDHRLYKIGKDGDQEVFDHELLDMLNGVNDYQTGLELKYVTAAHLEATGNAFWYLEGVTSENDKPLAIHIMLPSKVRVIVNREEFPTRIRGYQYRLGGKIYNFLPHEVIHIKYPDPNDPFEGIGTVQSIAQWIDTDNYAMEYNRRFFLNGASVGGFLETEANYTTDQLEYLKTSFEAAHKGVDNAHRVMALPKGTKYTEGGKTQKDMDFAQLSIVMRDRVIAGFKVPRTALGITDDVNRANAEATDYVFAARTIKPIMRFITSYLNEFLVPRYGDDIYLSFTDPVPEDRLQEADERAKSLGNAPYKSVNEVRAEAGLDPINGGDDVMAPFNFSPIGSSQDVQPKAIKKGKKSAGGKVLKSRFARNAEKRQSITKEITARAMEEVKELLNDIKIIKTKSRKDIAALSDDQYETLYKGFALRVTSYENLQRKAIESFNAKQRKEVIGNLSKISKAIKKSDIFDMANSLSAFVDISKPILYELAQKEGKEAAGLLGITDMDIMTPHVRNALDNAIALLSESYNTTTRDILKEKLEQGLEAGFGEKELTDIVNGVYEYSDEVRALNVARTETFRVANYSTQEAWKQSGIVKAQKWYTAVDERVCPFCEPMQGKIIGIDDDFFKKGDVVHGNDGSEIKIDYSDVGAPPLHPQCRCYIRPEQITLE